MSTFKGYRFRAEALPAPSTRPARRDLRGKTFGRLVVREELGSAGNGYRWWGCACACGALVAVRSRELGRGHTRSCGCLQRESLAAAGHNRLPVGHASRNELLASYRKSAASRGIAWGLSPEQFADLVAQPCAYCGSPASSVRKPNAGVNGGFVYSGLDRIDNAQGYTPSNVAPCCWVCNRAKGAMAMADFEAWISRLVAFRGGGRT